MRAEVARGTFGADRIEDRLEELDIEHRAVDRRPQPENEPPARGREDEADGTPEYSTLPDVVASGARNGHDQAGVGDHEERDPHPRDQDRRQQLSLGDE